MVSFFQEERDRNFFLACENIRKDKSYLSAADIAKQAVYTETNSFYLSYKECAKIINRYRKGKMVIADSSAKRELHEEIIKQYSVIESKTPGMRATDIAQIILSNKAPRFYITETRAANLYYELLKNKSLR